MLDSDRAITRKHSDAHEINHNEQDHHLLEWLKTLHIDTTTASDSKMDSPVMDSTCPFTIVTLSGNEDGLTLTPPPTPKTQSHFPPLRPTHRRRSSSDFCFDIKNIELDVSQAQLLGSGLWSKVYKLNPVLPSSARKLSFSPPTSPEATNFGTHLTPPTTPQKISVPFTLPRAFAIKVATRDDALPVFESEARILQHLQTDSASENYVIPFYGLSVRSKGLIFQCANHGTLEDLVNSVSSRTHSENLALFLEIAPQLIAGLRFLHSKGVVHADIKPANILLDQDVDAAQSTSGIRARFADFSASFLCADFGSLVLPQQAGAFGGTWTFMAPEQLSRDPTMSTPTFASDVYSLGVTLMSLIVGGNPFEAVNANMFMLREAIKMGDVLDFACRESEFEQRILGVGKEWKALGREGSLMGLLRPALKKKREDRCTAGQWTEMV